MTPETEAGGLWGHLGGSPWVVMGGGGEVPSQMKPRRDFFDPTIFQPSTHFTVLLILKLGHILVFH